MTMGGGNNNKHTHDITLTTAEMTTLKGNGTVKKASGNNSDGNNPHTHEVTVGCK